MAGDGHVGALVLLTLHPVVSATIVNGGHNDAFVGLAVLAAALLAAGPLRAGWALAAGVLVSCRPGSRCCRSPRGRGSARGTRAAIDLSAPPLALAFVSNAFVPGALHSVASADAGVVSRGSVWNLVLQAARGSPRRGMEARSHRSSRRGRWSSSCCSRYWLPRQALNARARVDGEVATATSAWLFAGAYTLPWYAGWSLPVAALQPASPVTALIVLQAGFLAASGTIPRAFMSRHARRSARACISSSLLSCSPLSSSRSCRRIGRHTAGHPEHVEPRRA